MSVYLSANFAPVAEEITATDLPTLGELPSELNGRYLRNGPNPIEAPNPLTHQWFLGDAMVHGIRWGTALLLTILIAIVSQQSASSARSRKWR